MEKTFFLKTTYSDPSLKNISELNSYLVKISRKNINLNLIRQHLFKTSWFEKEKSMIARCHLKSASIYLKYIIDNNIDYSNEQIKIVIVDLIDYVPLFHINEDISFILMNTNVLPSTIHFKTSEQLFYKNDINKSLKNNYSLDLLTVYSIRISLEKRILGLMGIDYITNNSQPVGLSKLIKITKSLKTVKYSDKINWDEIELINKWINHHVHRQLRPHPWIIHQAFEILKPLINPKEPVTIGTKKIYSFYSATLVDNETQLEKEILEKLKLEFSLIEIKWKSSRKVPKFKT